MTDVVLFAFGSIATAMCAGAIGVLVWAAQEDGRDEPVAMPGADRRNGSREAGLRRSA